MYDEGGLEILDGEPPLSLRDGPRIGIGYAAPEDVAARWRFADGESLWVSHRGKLDPS